MNTAQLQNDYGIAFDLLSTLYPIPQNFTLEYAHQVHFDRRPVWWLRFERSDGSNKGLEGEHFSLLVDTHNQRLMGLTLLARECRQPESPSEEKSTQLALQFMQKHC